MSAERSAVAGWLHERWEGLARIQAFLQKPLPRNVGWLHTLGSLLALYLGFQILTGVLLALYYNPSPEHAFASVRYVQEELRFGDLVYRLHRCGASFVVVTAVLHLLRSYFLAAYKKPRELVWMSGVLLLGLLMLFAFTGQLLPWDQRGYWATVVGIDIAASAPVLGGAVRDLLTGGYGDLGVTTLSRFYLLHVGLLPLLLLALLGLHLRLLQKSGTAGPLRGTPEPWRPFFPGQALRDGIAAALGALLLLFVALAASFSDSGPAGALADDFVPRPEWYFLAHYELLRLLPAGLQVVGTFVLPNALIALLLLLPFLDRKEQRGWRARGGWNLAAVLVLSAVVALTAYGVYTAPTLPVEPEEPAAVVGGGDEDLVVRGREVFIDQACETCHLTGDESEPPPEEPMLGPHLRFTGSRLQIEYLEAWLRDPYAFNPDTLMPPFEGSDEELALLMSYLQSLR